MSAFPFLQIPDFKAAAIADQDDFAFQSDFLAKIFRQNEAALLVGGTVLGSRMQVSKENAAIACADVRVGFGRRAHTRKFFRRHDQKKLVSRFRKNDEFFGVTASPARGNGDPILLVDEVTKFAGVEALVRRMHWRGVMFAVVTQ